jgi:hydrogenase-4 component E
VTDLLLWALAISTLAVVVVRRRTVAIALVALQSLLLGVQAISDARGRSLALFVSGLVLVAKAIALPLVLTAVVARTREPARIATERHALARLAIALAVSLTMVGLAPRLGLLSAHAEHVVVGMLSLGIVIALLRRPAIFQVLGFLVAENGLYLAALAVPGGVPAFIELGLVFDLVVIVSVAGAFSAKIHQELGTGDTSMLGSLRD